MSDKPVALITGAARGVGAAVAAEFARLGYDLAVTDVLGDELRATAKEVSSSGGRVESYEGDLSDPAFFEGLVDRAVTALGRVDVLVNNAIWRELTTMRLITLDSWEKTLRIGLTAPAFLARAVAGDMQRRSARGAIVNVSSIMAKRAAGLSPAYVAAKGGIEALTAELSALYGPRGIRVVAVRLGAVESPAGEGYGPGQAELRRYSEQMIPLGRWASPEEIAKTIAWLAGDEASYISGCTVTIDGGWSGQIHPRDIKASILPAEFS